MLYLCLVFVFCCMKCAFVSGDCDIISKEGWDGLKPIHNRYLPRPIKLIIIQHTATSTCTADASCQELLQSIQTNHMDNLHFFDIGPNFLIGNNGKAYEGSGWLHVGSHTYGYNSKSIGISFIGNFNINVPSPASLEAAQGLIACGVKLGHISPDYNLVAHRQLIAIESPGRKIYNVMRKWPHWLEDVTKIKN